MRINLIFPPSATRRLSYFGLLATLLGLATLLVFPTVALAQPMHAEYVSSDPSPEAVLKSAPAKITIHFSEGLDHKGSNILVYDIDHNQVSQPVQFDQADVKTMTVTIQPKDSEIYVVDWQTVSLDDGDHNAGSFRFFVNADATPTNSTPTSTAVAQTNNANSTSGTNSAQTNTSSSNGGIPVWLGVLIGVVALVVGGLAGAFGVGRLQKK
jgi:methionine-rich copper-binding protein CopC